MPVEAEKIKQAGRVFDDLFNGKSNPKSAEMPLPFIDISAWRANEGEPPREWGVRDLFPSRNVCLLSGEGATGKTLLALQLGIAHALGRDWLGTLPQEGPFLYFGAEDEVDELHRRLADILKSYGADFHDIAGKVHLLSLVGQDAVLGHANRAGLIMPTPLYAQLLKAASELRPAMICIDTSADVFAGNELDRAQVRQFVGQLRRLAIAANGYVLLCAHPSLTGINSGTGLSGSTGWHNSVRARAYLSSVKADKDDDEADMPLRKLEFKKSNYGPIAKSIPLQWSEGLFKLVAGPSSLEKMAREKAIETAFLDMLNRFNALNRNVTDKPNASNYAPTAFAGEPEAKKAKAKKADLEQAKQRLFVTKKIVMEAYGPACRNYTKMKAV